MNPFEKLIASTTLTIIIFSSLLIAYKGYCYFSEAFNKQAKEQPPIRIQTHKIQHSLLYQEKTME